MVEWGERGGCCGRGSESVRVDGGAVGCVSGAVSVRICDGCGDFKMGGVL